MIYKILATCPDEIKDIIAKDMQNLGFTNIKHGYRAVLGETDEEGYYLCHLRLPSASNIFRILREASAKSPQMLFSQAKRVHWFDIMDENSTFRVDAVAGDRGSDAMPSDLISKKTREAIEDVFSFHKKKKPQVDLKNPKLIISVLIREGRATFSVQTSGKSLHKRGYRLDGHPAPLKETLASAIIALTDYDGKKPFYDPMCGSGTLVIEATFAALGKSALIHRKKGDFGFEYLKDFNSALWRKVQEATRQNRRDEPLYPIFASDISNEFVELAQKNALRARVEKFISFKCQSFFDSLPPCSEPGMIVTNLPYGERLENTSLETFYKEIGDHLKRNYKGWQAWLLVNEDSPWKKIGLRTSKRINLLNGSIKTKLICFNLY